MWQVHCGRLKLSSATCTQARAMQPVLGGITVTVDHSLSLFLYGQNDQAWVCTSAVMSKICLKCSRKEPFRAAGCFLELGLLPGSLAKAVQVLSVVLGIKLKASCILGQCYIAEPHPALQAVYFRVLKVYRGHEMALGRVGCLGSWRLGDHAWHLRRSLGLVHQRRGPCRDKLWRKQRGHRED